MVIKVYKSINDTIRKDATFDERWGSLESSLISAWESGRVNRDKSFKELLPLLEKGALPKLSFKGGHIMPPYKNETPKYKFKYGTFNYLAQLQGLLGQDLDIDVQGTEDVELVCKLTGLKTILTTNQDNYK